MLSKNLLSLMICDFGCVKELFMRSTVFALVIVLVLSTAESSSFFEQRRTGIQGDFVGGFPHGRDSQHAGSHSVLA